MVEICYVNRTAFVNSSELNKVKTATNSGQTRSIGDNRLNADGFVGHGKGNGLELASVLITPREEGNKVTNSQDAEPVECQCLFFAYTFKYLISVLPSAMLESPKPFAVDFIGICNANTLVCYYVNLEAVILKPQILAVENVFSVI